MKTRLSSISGGESRARASNFGRSWSAMGAIAVLIWAKVLRRATTDDAKPGCIFCQREDPEVNELLGQNKTFYARYDNFPAAVGHVELVSKRHVESYFELCPREVKDAYALMCEVEAEIAKKWRPDGYTIGVNEGEAAGRTVDHLHIHLIPRRKGDVDDPRGGVRQALPTRDPDEWAHARAAARLTNTSAAVSGASR